MKMTGLSLNPLFIGEVSSTRSEGRLNREYRRLNPLFIGEVSSTDLQPLIAAANHPSQSPLHRGGLFNHYDH